MSLEKRDNNVVMATIEQLKKQRTAQRSGFTKVLNALNAQLVDQQVSVEDVLVNWQLLQEKNTFLVQTNQTLQKKMVLDKDSTEDSLFEEIESEDEYTSKFLKAKIIVDDVLFKAQAVPTMPTAMMTVQPVKAKLKLPTIDLVKFSGNTREWLRFWGQFNKIHQNSQIPEEDKFEYLIAAIVPGSRASELIERFPPTGDNYTKAIDSLKNRFGRDELLVEVYVRELLTLVLQNASKAEKVTLISLYDKLESHLQALDTLGVTTDKCAAMLFPLVKSSLPEEILRVWQRTSEAKQAVDCKNRLDALMKFIGTEVEAEEKIQMAANGFGFNSEVEKSKKTKVKEVVTKNIPTAVGLLAARSKKEVSFL